MQNQREKEYKISYKYLLIIFSVIIIIAMGKVVRPYIYGDGFEYTYMIEAFQNHFSPDVNKQDILNTQSILKSNNIIINNNPYSGFFKSYSKKMCIRITFGYIL